MKRKNLFFTAVIAIIAFLVSSCESPTEKTPEKEKATYVNLYDIFKGLADDSLELKNDSAQKPGRDSILNGRKLYFFWFSEEKLDNDINVAGFDRNNSKRLFTFYYVNGSIQYTGFSHNSKPPFGDAMLVFVGDSTTKTAKESGNLDSLIFERMNRNLFIN